MQLCSYKHCFLASFLCIGALLRGLVETKCINKAYNSPLQRENTALARSLQLQMVMNWNRSVYIICTKVVALKVGCDCSKSSLFSFSHKEKVVDIFHRKGKRQSLCLSLVKSHCNLKCW